jgi:hypothetical protein
MTLPVGTISLSQVNTELNLPSTQTISLNQAAVRTLAGVPSGIISMDNLRGKSNRVAYTITISGNTTNYDTYANRGPQYSPGISDITYSISPGIFVNSTSTGSAAMTVPASFNPGDTVTIINNGVIVGRGGNGGNGGRSGNLGPVPTLGGSPGGSGGGGLQVSRPTTVTNNNRISGGGGGGGGGGGFAQQNPDPEGAPSLFGGSGGGGGIGNSSGGAGAVGNTGSGNPGGGGNLTSAGGGGSPQFGGPNPGGPGGSYGSGGSPGSAGSSSPGTGGASGFAISGDPFITWPAFGTRNGPIS